MERGRSIKEKSIFIISAGAAEMLLLGERRRPRISLLWIQ
jgi:hypothetical protein